MGKIKDFYNRNRIYSILMIISIICLIIVAVAFIYYYLIQNKSNSYGDRLNGIETVEIKDTKEKINKIKDNENIEKVTINIKGKIIYINIKLNKGTVEDAQNIAIKSLEAFSAEEKEYYDFSYGFTYSGKDETAALFPIMGYKKSDATVISWTKISDKSTKEEKK